MVGIIQTCQMYSNNIGVVYSDLFNYQAILSFMYMRAFENKNKST